MGMNCVSVESENALETKSPAKKPTESKAVNNFENLFIFPPINGNYAVSSGYKRQSENPAIKKMRLVTF